MKLVIAEKPSVAKEIAAVLGANERKAAITRAAAILCRGVSATLSALPTPPHTTSNTENGGMRIYLSCRRNGNTSWQAARNSSLPFSKVLCTGATLPKSSTLATADARAN